MKQTTALRKIAKMRKRIKGVQGGQGAGKTIAIMILIINHLARKKNKECYVISAELSKMRDTVLKDTIKILQSFGLQATIMGKDHGQAKVTFPTGSFIRFIGMDKDDIGKGLRSDIIFVNEANKINFESYREATSRAKNIFIDFNPNAKFWFHDEIQNRDDCDFEKLTFLDNEYLSFEERSEILLYHKKGYGAEFDSENPDAEHPELNKYWANKWRVYGRGEIGVIEGAVYEDWEIIDEIPTEARLVCGGVDFGFVNPAAWVMVYRWNGRYIFDQIIYESKLSNQDLAEMIIEAELQHEIHYADSAEPKSIDEIRKMGVNIHPCDSKRDLVNYGVQLMNKEKFYVTKDSVDVIQELYGYTWDMDSKGNATGKPRKKNDHAMNAMQYAVGTEGKYDGTYR